MPKKIFISLCLALILAVLGAVTLAVAQGTVVLTIDIKPCKEPNILNINQPGALPVAIYPGDGIDIADIDGNTVTLEGVPTLESKDKGDYLLVKFDAQKIITALGDVHDGEVITLTLFGETKDGYSFTGTDEVLIRVRGR